MAFGDDTVENIVAVGTVDHRSARIWFRAERPGSYVLEISGPGGALHGRATVRVSDGNATDNTTTVLYPGPDRDLAPLTRYDVKIASEDGLVFVGEAQFETAPATPNDVPATVSVGVFSYCGQSSLVAAASLGKQPFGQSISFMTMLYVALGPQPGPRSQTRS